jgi:hypothetical protein
MLSLSKSTCKIGGQKPLKMKLLRRSCSESSRISRGSAKNKNPSWGGKHHSSMVKLDGSTSIERARLIELQYIIDILRQQEQR